MQRSNELDRIGWVHGLVGLVLMFVGFFAIDEGGSLGPIARSATLRPKSRPTTPGPSLAATSGFSERCYLWVLLRRCGYAWRGKVELLALAAYAFGIVMTVGAVVHGSFRLATSAVIAPNNLADAILPLSILKEHISDLLFVGAVGVVAVMAIGSFVVGLLPRGFSWLGMALVVATIALFPTDRGAGLALFLWLIAACAVLLSKGSAEIDYS